MSTELGMKPSVGGKRWVSSTTNGCGSLFRWGGGKNPTGSISGINGSSGFSAAHNKQHVTLSQRWTRYCLMWFLIITDLHATCAANRNTFITTTTISSWTSLHSCVCIHTLQWPESSEVRLYLLSATSSLLLCLSHLTFSSLWSNFSSCCRLCVEQSTTLASFLHVLTTCLKIYFFRHSFYSLLLCKPSSCTVTCYFRHLNHLSSCAWACF